MPDISPQILGAIIGASISLIAAIIVLIFTNIGHNKRQRNQHTHEGTKEKRKHLQEKIENCYLSFSKWEKYFGGMYIGMIGYVKGEMSEEKAYELGRRGAQSGNIEQVEMTLDLYFPHLKHGYNDMYAARGEIVKYFPPNPSVKGGLKSYYEVQENFEKKAKLFKQALQSELQNL